MIWIIDAGEHVHKRGFPAPIFAQKRKNFPFAQRKADVVVCNDLSECFSDVAHLDCVLDLFHAFASRSRIWLRAHSVRSHIPNSISPAGKERQSRRKAALP